MSWLAFTALAQAQSSAIFGPVGSGAFGTSVTVLPNSNFVVTDPEFDSGSIQNVGALYLYNGSTKALISTLTGSTANDRVGNGGVTVLGNGNYVVISSNWANGAAYSAGAVTWGSATAGVAGVVSATNSLVGSTAYDQLGFNNYGPTLAVLTNGNYVVCSPYWHNGTIGDAGAATWGNGTTGVKGVISAANSLVGSNAGDYVGVGGVCALSNGNYVVGSNNWKNGTVVDAGAATWGSGTAGVKGTISSANSLVGSRSSDFVGGNITALTNGHYVVCSNAWDNGTVVNAGAATWGSGTTGVKGTISSANSLVGTHANDEVATSIVPLTNGNYVVRSYGWNNGTVAVAGAATWGSGTTGVKGAVSSANSLVGSRTYDQIGGFGVVALTNGNYVVCAPFWNTSTLSEAGAATWGSGTAGVTGTISSSNSLIGSSDGDRVGFSVTPLTNGNYVVCSYQWDNGAVSEAGAATWGSGTAGVKGTISAANSLVGTRSGDYVGQTITALANGHYVVGSPSWSTATLNEVGAATWGSGTAGVKGTISAANSLVGSKANDGVSRSGITALTNGHYVVGSYEWDNGTATDAGAVTWGNGGATVGGVKGAVNVANSLVGSKANDNVGYYDRITALTNGHYVVSSDKWDNGAVGNAGAATWGNGTAGVKGVISSTNSLVGTTANDQVGAGVQSFPYGHYVVRTYGWTNGSISYAGAITEGSGTGGTVGPVTPCNSTVGSVVSSYPVYDYDVNTAMLLVGLPKENRVVLGKGPPDAPTGAASQTLSSGATVANLTATGTGLKWYATGTGGTALSTTTALVDGSTYYASQTLGGCESTGRLAVVVSIPNTISTGTIAGAPFCAGVAVAVPYTGTGTYTSGNVFTAQLSDAGGSFAAPVAVGTLSSQALSGTLEATLPVGTAAGSGYRLRVVASAPAVVGTDNGTNLAVVAPTADLSSQYLAAASTSQAAPVGTGTARYFTDGSCRAIATLLATGAALGSTTAAVYVQTTAPSYGPRAYVRRYYDLNPATNAATATANITLYFTQADFSDYNAANGTDPDLPTGPADATGISHLRFQQEHGTSASGLPGTFTGWAGSGPARVVLDPADTDVVWNASASRWEVTVAVTGFSGFFAYGDLGSAPLPVELLSFEAEKRGPAVVLDWRTASEKNSARFEVERSRNGKEFERIGQVAAQGSKASPTDYTHRDNRLPAVSTLYYRLRQVDQDGTASYSPVRAVALGRAEFAVYPNPARATIGVSGVTAGAQLELFDSLGRLVTAATADASGAARLVLPSGQAAGIYVLRGNGQTQRVAVE